MLCEMNGALEKAGKIEKGRNVVSLGQEGVIR